MSRPYPIVLAAIAAAFFSLALISPAQADSYRDYCHQRAQDLSGYRGGGGSVVGGAVGGAVRGAIIAGILGGDKKDRRRAAGAGALIGGLKAANRPNGRAARIYRLEFEACMRQR